MKVSLYRCFKADQRISMEVFADGLTAALTASGLTPQSYVPHSSLERFKDSAWVMRYLRYRYYPQWVKKTNANDTQIHHVTDHGYAHLFPSLKNGKKILSVHDLIPLLTWKGVIKKDKNGELLVNRKPSLNLYSLKFIKSYDHIVTISQSTANDLQQYLNMPAELITVVPPVIDDQYIPASSIQINALRKKYQLSEDVKWLMVTGREYYKNHKTCLLALKEIIENSSHQVRLIKTGMPSPEFKELVEQLDLSDYVRYLFLEDMTELPVLYSLVDCLLFPSLYEGFGMPVAEALACGTPVVMSDRASLPEAGGDLAIMCDAFDVQSLAEAVTQQFCDNAKKTMLEQGPNWVRQFRQDVVGDKMLRLYKSIL